MNKSLRLFTAAAALAAAAALFYTCARQIQKQRFIDARLQQHICEQSKAKRDFPWTSMS